MRYFLSPNQFILAIILIFIFNYAKSENLDIYSYTLYYIGNVTAGEYNSLPSYCRDLMQSGPPGYKKYKLNEYDKSMLRGIRGKHHFCNIFVLKQRLFKYPAKRNSYLAKILEEAQYVIKDTDPDAPIKVLAYLEKASVLEKLHKPLVAESAYFEALQFGSKYELVYMEFSRFYERQRNHKMALDIISLGIKQSTSTDLLLRRYKELGGPLPVPEPEPVSKSEAPVSADSDTKNKENSSSSNNQ